MLVGPPLFGLISFFASARNFRLAGWADLQDVWNPTVLARRCCQGLPSPPPIPPSKPPAGRCGGPQGCPALRQPALLWPSGRGCCHWVAARTNLHFSFFQPETVSRFEGLIAKRAFGQTATIHFGPVVTF